MASTKAKDWRLKEPASLKEQLALLKKEQFNLRFRKATAQIENVARQRQIRREIAQIMTVLTEKSIVQHNAGTV